MLMLHGRAGARGGRAWQMKARRKKQSPETRLSKKKRSNARFLARKVKRRKASFQTRSKGRAEK